HKLEYDGGTELGIRSKDLCVIRTNVISCARANRTHPVANSADTSTNGTDPGANGFNSIADSADTSTNCTNTSTNGLDAVTDDANGCRFSTELGIRSKDLRVIRTNIVSCARANRTHPIANSADASTNSTDSDANCTNTSTDGLDAVANDADRFRIRANPSSDSSAFGVLHRCHDDGRQLGSLPRSTELGIRSKDLYVIRTNVVSCARANRTHPIANSADASTNSTDSGANCTNTGTDGLDAVANDADRFRIRANPSSDSSAFGAPNWAYGPKTYDGVQPYEVTTTDASLEACQEAPNWAYGPKTCSEGAPTQSPTQSPGAITTNGPTGAPTEAPTFPPSVCFTEGQRFTRSDEAGEPIDTISSALSADACQANCALTTGCEYFAFRYAGANPGRCELYSSIEAGTTSSSIWLTGPRSCVSVPTLAPTRSPTSSPTECYTEGFRYERVDGEQPFETITTDTDAEACQAACQLSMRLDLLTNVFALCTHDPAANPKSNGISNYTSANAIADNTFSHGISYGEANDCGTDESVASVVEIVLPDNGLEGVLPAEIMEPFTNFQLLNLSGNDITGDGPDDCVDIQRCYEDGVICDVPNLCGEVFGVNPDGTPDWTPPTDGETDMYPLIELEVGESVFFNFSEDSNVVQMSSQTAFENCEFSGSVVLASASQGSYRFVAKKDDAGDTVYIASSLPTSSHESCENGQRVAIAVEGTTTAPTSEALDPGDDDDNGVPWWVILLVALVLLCCVLPCLLCLLLACAQRCCPERVPERLAKPLDRFVRAGAANNTRDQALGFPDPDGLAPYTALPPRHQRSAPPVLETGFAGFAGAAVPTPAPTPAYDSNAMEVFLAPHAVDGVLVASEHGDVFLDEEDRRAAALRENPSLKQAKLQALAMNTVVSRPISSMEDLLREANLEQHIPHFRSEHMDLEAVTFASEGQLRELGLSMGEAVRLRHITRTLQRKLAQTASAPATGTVTSTTPSGRPLRGVLKKPHPTAYAVPTQRAQFGPGDPVTVHRVGAKVLRGRITEVRDAGHATREPRYVVEIAQQSRQGAAASARQQVVRESELRAA
ncbi:Hypothetical Protein FCC1311_012912, partial [Hondaea fermentalgiana]